MLCLVKLLLVPVIMFLRSRRDLLLEIFALRQQLAVLKRRRSHPRLAVTDTPSGDIVALLVPLAGDIDSRSAGDRCAMAPSRFQAVLDLALATSNSRRQEGRQRFELRQLTSAWLRTSNEEPRRIHGELRCLASTFLNGPSCAGCGKRQGIQIRQSDGRPF